MYLNHLSSICGTLHSVDQYLNIKLTDISVTDPEKYPHMLSVKNCFIRGSVVSFYQNTRTLNFLSWEFTTAIPGTIHPTARRGGGHTTFTGCCTEGSDRHSMIGQCEKGTCTINCIQTNVEVLKQGICIKNLIYLHKDNILGTFGHDNHYTYLFFNPFFVQYTYMTTR